VPIRLSYTPVKGNETIRLRLSSHGLLECDGGGAPPSGGLQRRVRDAQLRHSKASVGIVTREGKFVPPRSDEFTSCRSRIRSLQQHTDQNAFLSQARETDIPNLKSLDEIARAGSPVRTRHWRNSLIWFMWPFCMFLGSGEVSWES
jgi:hypothetical protein